ncbi:FT-interacting protein 3-like [Arachis stenosperma]|uniref:FT-interacting protein 3-like n=1 Tax=Arachis stenosperma TaxID=217475 RepID=UPI0025ACABF2|nr:FT-interacting protein 3-like [Arachis stenosperma]XP_057754461.1 FT-interacting protein 3-like [Arachis stenosperma]
MNNLKLAVEVVSAHDLAPKDGEGSSSPFVELQFDGQKFRTTTKEKDLSPVWDETFYFNITDPSMIPSLNLEAFVYHYNKTNGSKVFLGKVRLTGASFVSYSDAVLLHYPLEKKRFFSKVQGELGLKVYVTNDNSMRASNPLPNFFQNNTYHIPMQDQTQLPFPDPVLREIPIKKSQPNRHTFHNIAKSNKGEKQQPNSAAAAAAAGMPNVSFSMNEMKSAKPAAKVMNAFAGSASPVDHVVRETSPVLGGGKVVGGRVIRGNIPASTYDLVEPMEYLFVRVVKARDLPSMDVTGSLDPYVEVKIGNFKGNTNHFEKNQSPEWNQVFAFAKENLQSSILEVVVKDKDVVLDDVVGNVKFNLYDVPRRAPPDSPLAPEWYRIENKKGEKNNGEIMLAVWYGSQADEAFPDAWHSDAISPNGSSSSSHYAQIRSKVYHSPRLWYVRVKVIEAQDLVPSEKSRIPDAYVKVQIGNQILKTRPVQSRMMNPQWNQDLMLVAAEPFEEPLILTVEDRLGNNKDETIGNVIIPVGSIDKRADDRPIRSRWYPLEKFMSSARDMENGKQKEKDKDKFFSRIHVNVFLEGGYHVLDESTYYSSDLRPSTRVLWKKQIGVLELGILDANVIPMKTREGRGTSDAYCVAKYGQKWVRTRTVIGSISPKFNEQYTWEVYDPSTVLTLGVFDNGQVSSSNGNGNRDSKIGKVRIRLSTLESGRIYTHTYPLLMLHNSGVKKMGEIHLAIRFSCTSFVNMLNLYFKPHLPKMHYVKPLNIIEQDRLKQQAVIIVSARLSRAEPPLRKEVVEYLSDSDSHLWSMRRSKANFNRLKNVFSGLISVAGWLGEISTWKNSVTTVLVHILFLMLVCFPELILPTIFLYMFVIGMWKWRFRPRYPPHMDTRLSCADVANPDELDEEMDTFPTTRSSDLVRWRYDRLRSLAGRVQSVVGDIAAQGERLHALINWRDPRATAIFMVFCIVAAIVLYVVPLQLMFIAVGFYLMRHPKLRSKTPPAPVNFFRRLPALTDSML